MFGGDYLCDRIFAVISKDVKKSKALQNNKIDRTRKSYNNLEEWPYFTQVFSGLDELSIFLCLMNSNHM